ncbi:MAG: hypothetical protein P8L66_00325 [Rhodospirillaceae bacterium]|nr:hypothetical protein [Rhodospirillaceae bacterium]
MKNLPPKDPRFVFGDEIDGPGKQFFDNQVLDNIHESLLELTAAVWTYRDRAILLERILNDVVGKDISTMIEAYEPTPADNAARAAERAELVSNVFRRMSRGSVDVKFGMDTADELGGQS